MSTIYVLSTLILCLVNYSIEELMLICRETLMGKLAYDELCMLNNACNVRLAASTVTNEKGRIVVDYDTYLVT